VLSLGAGIILPTLNYERPDPQCPLQIVQGAPAKALLAVALLVSWTPAGQAAAIVLAGPD
jgi:3-oxoacyl-(acyl-carrier-protein) synthase